MSFLKPAAHFGVIAALLTFLGNNKRWWLVPMVATLLVFGVLIVLGGNSAMSPFMYKVP